MRKSSSLSCRICSIYTLVAAMCTSRHPTTPHSDTHTHLHHREVPVLGCHVKAAAVVVVREDEEVASALLDEQLW